jgi:hypothetical protein
MKTSIAAAVIERLSTKVVPALLCGSVRATALVLSVHVFAVACLGMLPVLVLSLALADDGERGARAARPSPVTSIAIVPSGAGSRTGDRPCEPLDRPLDASLRSWSDRLNP